MASWALLIQVFSALQPAFARGVSFLWFQVIIIGLISRPDDEGVTSIVRGVGLGERAYGSILKHFERVSCNLPLLSQLWTRSVLKHLDGQLYRFNGRMVLVADSTKGAKSGERMPGVKLLRSSKSGPDEAKYVRGHHMHVMAALARFGSDFVALPLVARLCEGIKLGPNDRKRVRDKMVEIQDEAGELPPSYVLADRFYASANYIAAMLQRGHHVVCRVKANAVCQDLLDPPSPGERRGRGRPPKYDNREKVALRADRQSWHTLPCPWDNKTLRVTSFVAFWEPLHCNLLWVVARHPDRSSPFIVLSTDLTLSTHDVLHKLYAARWSIETGFMFLKKQLALFMYRFWTSATKRRKNPRGDLYLHRMEEEQREAILAKVASYNYFAQCAVIAQGLLQIVSIKLGPAIRAETTFFFRTIREGKRPSEMLVRKVLIASLSNFLQEANNDCPLRKFFSKAKANEDFPQIMRLAA